MLILLGVHPLGSVKQW